MWGYQASCLQVGGPKTKFFLSYFTHYSGTDTQGSQEFIPNFSCRQFDMDEISSDCICVT